MCVCVEGWSWGGGGMGSRCAHMQIIEQSDMGILKREVNSFIS